MAASPPSADADRVFRLADGRRMAYREFGAPDGWPVLALHGTPGSRLMFSVAAQSAAQLGLRLIAPDRWGYGRTDLHPRPSLSAWARDAAELVAGLGLSQLSLVGLSGGSPYAAATAAELGKVKRLALAVPVGPMADNDTKHRLGLFHRLLFFGIGRRPRLVERLLGGYKRLIDWKPRHAISFAAIGQCPPDRMLLRTPYVQDFLSETFRDGLEPGTRGPAIDLELFSRSWDVPLQRISSETRIWIGKEDRLVPLSAARRLAAAIPGAIVTELDGRGHFWIVPEHRQVLEWLAAEAKENALRP